MMEVDNRGLGMDVHKRLSVPCTTNVWSVPLALQSTLFFTSAHCHSGGAGLFRALMNAFAFVAFDIFSAAVAQDIGTIDMLGSVVAAAMMISWCPGAGQGRGSWLCRDDVDDQHCMSQG